MKIKVGIVAPFDLNYIYGNTLRPIKQAQGLKANGFNDFVVYCSKKNPSLKFPQIELKKKDHIDFLKKILPDSIKKKDFLFNCLAFKLPAGLPSILHLHNYYSIQLVPKNYSGKIITDWHAFKSVVLTQQYLQKNKLIYLLANFTIIPWVQKLEQRSLKRASHIIAAADNILQLIKKENPDYEKKCSLINNLILTNKFLSNDHSQDFNLGLIGPYDHINLGVIEEIKIIAKRLPNIQIRMAGSIKPQIINKLKSYRNIQILGKLTEQDYIKFLSSISVLLLPYKTHILGGGSRNKLLEAAVSQTPIISTIGGAKGFLHKENLNIVSSIDEMIEAILLLQKDKKLRKVQGKRLNRIIKKEYDYLVQTQKLIDIYHSLSS